MAPVAYTLGSLFSGCGGLDLGLERGAGLATRWHVQRDPEHKRQPCNTVLARHWPDVPNFGDVERVEWDGVERVDVLAGGFPCQDVSYAGLRAGLADGTRSGLWFSFARAIRALRPRVVVVENVSGLLTAGFGVVMADLAEAGYDASWCCLRAADVGAPHRRERVFVVASPADAERERLSGWGAARNVLREAARAEGARPQRQRDRLTADDRGAAAPHAGGLGRVERPGLRSGDERGHGRRLADDDGGPLERRDRGAARGSEHSPASDAAGERRLRREERDRGDAARRQEAERREGDAPAADGDRDAWGAYGAAVRRWELVLGRRAPRPTDARGRLEPRFVEWMLGFPDGWTDGVTRPQRLKMLGNAVQVQAAEVVGYAVRAVLEAQEAS